MFRKLALVASCSAVFVMGCRDDSNNNFNPVDLSMPQGGAGGMGGAGGAGGAGGDAGTTTVKCTGGYTDTTIAAMRSGAKSGCFRVGMMADVVSLAVQSTSTHSSLYIQDAAGGDNSALPAACDTRMTATTAGYGCTMSTFTTFKGSTIGDKVVVSGFYVYDNKTMPAQEFFNVIDTFSDSGTKGTAPAPLALALTDVARTSTTITPAKLYQYAAVTIPSGTTLKAYEWAPAAFKPTKTWTSCSSFPYTFGFGIYPSTDTAAAGPACTAGTIPMPAATPATDEILIDTTFYTNFTWTSDCQCYMAGKGNLMAATDTFSKLQGLVVYASGAIPAIAPLANADLGK